MKQDLRYAQNNLAAGFTLLLAVLLITGCNPSTAASLPENRATTVPARLPTATAVSVAANSVASTSRPSTSIRALTATAVPATPTTLSATATSLPTLPPASPTPSLSPQTVTATTPARQMPSTNGVKSYKTTVTLSTYPYNDYLVEQVDPVYNMPVFYFNRPDFDAAAPTPMPITYNGVVLENAYLRLTFLPELGGRLYSAVIKATNQEIFYHNPVIKPSRYGGLHPAEANWWLAAGGMEWAYPTYEHGYRFGTPWNYTVDVDSSGATITLSDTAPNRTSLSVDVSLPAGSAAFTVVPTLTNNGPNTAPVQLWTNAALALSSGSMSPNTQFVLPVKDVTIHNRGEEGWTLPAAGTTAPWPQVGQTDLSDYNQWANYLGFFVPNQNTPFMGAVNPATKLGIVRWVDNDSHAGAGKIFAFGTGFPDRSYTDDNSQYFEIWGGANAGFWPENDIPVPSGQTLGWQEQWWPLAGLKNLSWATQHVAVNLSQSGTATTLSALVARPTQGHLNVQTGDVSLLATNFSAIPNSPLQWQFTAKSSPVTIEFTDNNNNLLLTYQIN